MKTIIKLTLSILIGITTFSSCKPKTPHEQFLASMEGKTDSELVQEMYGKVYTYKVYKISAYKENSFNIVEVTGPKVKIGAVLNITFSDHSIFIEGFDNLNGSYQSEYYASTSGEFSAKFITRHDLGIGQMNTSSGRRHPSDKSKYIQLVQTAKTTNGFTEFNIEVSYYLERI